MAALHILAGMALAHAIVQEVPPDPAPRPQQQASAPQEAAPDAAADAGQSEAQPPAPDPAQAALQQPLPASVPPPDQAPPLYPGQAGPAPIAIDARIQSLPYDPNQIVTLGVGLGFASIVELAPDERVENVVVGNSAAWQVTANRRGDRVIVKPLAGASRSNMIVLTASRRYVFVLDPFAETSFILRFSYPQPVAVTPVATVAQVAYRFHGDKALFPLAMSDNGRQTVVRWGDEHALPAVFAMSDRTHEQLVNARMVGNDYIIEGAAPRYKFRYGKSEAIAVRQTPKRRR